MVGVPFADFKIITEEFLEAEDFGVGQVSLLQTPLPFADEVETVGLSETTGHRDVTSC